MRIEGIMLAASKGDAIVWIGIWTGAMLVAAMAALILTVRLRRKLQSRGGGPQRAFTLEQVRSLHRQGLISDEEYEQLRQRSLAEQG